jgi:predicted transcriptional regulator
MSQQGKSLSDDAIAMVRTVFDACSKESSSKKRTVSVLHPRERTANYLGLSVSTVSKYVYGKNNAHATSRKLHSVELKKKQLAADRTKQRHDVHRLKDYLRISQNKQQKVDAIPRTRAKKRKTNSDFNELQEQIQQSITHISQQSSPKRRRIVALTNTTQQLQKKLVELKEQPAPQHGTHTALFCRYAITFEFVLML